MSKREHYLIVDTETTINDRVYDFAAVITDRKGRIYNQCAVIIAESRDETLFHRTDIPQHEIWSRRYAEEKRQGYAAMLAAGTRTMASVNAVNRWLEKAKAHCSPMLTAYNLNFDMAKCRNTGIDLDMFPDRFCLWNLAYSMIARTKEYRQFVLENHLFRPPTKQGNMSYYTKAETVARFITGIADAEPHTALEDIIGYELPILTALTNRKGWKKNLTESFDWRKLQVKDHFKVA